MFGLDSLGLALCGSPILLVILWSIFVLLHVRLRRGPVPEARRESIGRLRRYCLWIAIMLSLVYALFLTYMFFFFLSFFVFRAKQIMLQ